MTLLIRACIRTGKLNSSASVLFRFVPQLFDRRLIFVTGKGGVGKSTVAIALGLLAARRGLRTIVAELQSQERVQQAFEHGAQHFVEVELAPRLFTISIDPQHAMEEYLRIKTGPVGHAIGSSKLFQAFTMATPGMRELLSIGKIWELAQLERRTRGAAPYDVVMVDAPATGHGVGLLRTPRTFADIARVGPVAHQARQIAATIADRSLTAIVAVATPEEMPINETVSLRQALAKEQLDLDLVVVNGLYPPRFDEAQIARVQQAMQSTEESVARGALRAALSEHARLEAQRRQLARLTDDLSMNGRLVELPFLFADHVGPAELERLADALGRQL
jgi:anion-transporting  ArsA/GET3 family ATPase